MQDEPEYGGFLRGRMARLDGRQLIVVYCREDALSSDRKRIDQFVTGMGQLPVPTESDALVISDNGDIYGTIADLVSRAEER